MKNHVEHFFARAEKYYVVTALCFLLRAVAHSIRFMALTLFIALAMMILCVPADALSDFIAAWNSIDLKVKISVIKDMTEMLWMVSLTASFMATFVCTDLCDCSPP